MDAEASFDPVLAGAAGDPDAAADGEGATEEESDPVPDPEDPEDPDASEMPDWEIALCAAGELAGCDLPRNRWVAPQITTRSTTAIAMAAMGKPRRAS